MKQNRRNFLEESVYTLLQSERWYAYFILESRISYDSYGVKTAAATIVGGVPMLIFNTEFMNSLTKLQAVAVVKHEILHLLMSHHSRHNKGFTSHAINIAMDCAINQYITGLPDSSISVESLEKICGKPLLRLETSEYYLHQMAEAEKNKKGCFECLNTTDDHDLVVPGSETSEEMRKMAVKATSEKALGRSAGMVPDGISKILGELQANTLDWKSILRNFISRNASSKTLLTRKKLHRRFGLDQPGRKKKKELILGICMDVSGSVPDMDVQKFYAELSSMLPSTSAAWLVQADCVIQSVEKITKASQLKVQRNGNGGTAYGPAIEACKAKKCDAIIYFGDLDCADTPTDPGVNFLWVTTGSDTKPGNFGSLVRLS